MEIKTTSSKKLTSYQIIILGFAGVILLGTFLLMLPFSSNSGEFTSLGDALFTSTSAVCVTGLVVKDTATYWSGFGQAIILLLIQIGGVGVVTIAAFLAMLSGRKISLMQRSTMQDALSAPQVGGIVKLTIFILKASLAVELIGAILLLPVFYNDFGAAGIWMSVFHSVSAFCNAGFDIMGNFSGEYSSLTSFSSNGYLTAIICLLIIIGGIGFLTWDDIITNKFRFKRYRMQSKVIIFTTAVLLLVPSIYYFFADFKELSMNERICQSVFQAVTPRTAGFNTANLSLLSGNGRLVMIILMLIGGSPGSTAGGMKTTTLAVLFANSFSVFRRKKSAQFFGRRIEDSVIKTASTCFTLYLFFSILGAFVISLYEKLPFGTCIFETMSAIGTVGLSLGITPSLGVLSRLILIYLMFFGRVGGLTLIFAAGSRKNIDISQCPTEKIMIG